MLYENKPIIKAAEALKIFNTFVLPYKHDSAGFKVLKQWNVSQTRLLQFAVRKQTKKLGIHVGSFEHHHWSTISKNYFLGICSGTQCHKRWLYTQGLCGIKTTWS